MEQAQGTETVGATRKKAFPMISLFAHMDTSGYSETINILGVKRILDSAYMHSRKMMVFLFTDFSIEDASLEELGSACFFGQFLKLINTEGYALHASIPAKNDSLKQLCRGVCCARSSFLF
jgi:hypothetical protein